MRKMIYFFVIMVYSVHVDAMMNKLKIRRCRSYSYERPKIEKKSIGYFGQGTFDPRFPKEVDKNILSFIATNTAGETLQETAKIFSALIYVNKFTYMHMNDDQRVLEWIKDFSKRFDCTNIDVAKALRTRAAKHRHSLQLGF